MVRLILKVERRLTKSAGQTNNTKADAQKSNCLPSVNSRLALQD